MAESLTTARDCFLQESGIATASTLRVESAFPHERGGLQAVDYFLWALQRLYNRQEDRFIRLLWDKVSLVQDVDDTRRKQYGEYYRQRNPLTAEDIKKRGLRI